MVAIFGGGYLLIRVTERPFLWPLGVLFGLTLGADVPERAAGWLRRHDNWLLVLQAVRALLGIGAVVGLVTVVVRFLQALRTGGSTEPHRLAPGIEAFVLVWVFVTVILISIQVRASGLQYVLAALGLLLLLFGIVVLADYNDDSVGFAVVCCAVGTQAIFNLVLPTSDRDWLSVVASTFLLAAAVAWIPQQPLDSVLAAGFAALYVHLPLEDWNGLRST